MRRSSCRPRSELMPTPLSAVVDNDILIKAAAYGVLSELAQAVAGRVDSVGILGVARYVVSAQLRKRGGVANRALAAEHFAAVLAGAKELEPSDVEVELATTIEEAAARRQLDTGEAQLFAVGVVRRVASLLTGDKRAIAAAEDLLPDVDRLVELARRVVCLEQALALLLARTDPRELRTRVCANPVDTAITICFTCYSTPEDAFYPLGLHSYIDALRNAAPILLAPGPERP